MYVDNSCCLVFFPFVEWLALRLFCQEIALSRHRSFVVLFDGARFFSVSLRYLAYEAFEIVEFTITSR